MDFPPPEISIPPPLPPMVSNFQAPPPFQHPGGFQPRPFNPNYHHHHKPFFNKYKHGMQVQDDFDGKRLRKSVMRKTVDYNASIIKALEVSLHLLSLHLRILTFYFNLRIAYGSEIIEIEDPFSQKTVTFLILCHHRVILTIRAMR